MHRGAVDAAVGARGGGGREFALGARQAGLGVVEDVLVGPGAGAEDVRVARQQHEIGRLGARGIDEAGPVALGQLGLGQRLEPGQPAEFGPG